MSTVRHHADWLSLVEVSGPFVSLPVLLRAFPQGLEPRDPAQAKQLRSAYEEWQDHPTAPGKQRAWVLHVLCELLGYPVIQIAEGQSLPAGLEANMAEQGETLRPDFALIGPAGTEAAGQAQLLICNYPAEQLLDKPVIGKHWKSTPATRMMELLHGTNVPLGLVTNGEHWMLVYAPRGETTGYASWYGALWLDEPITLRAFQSLLGVRRFFGVAADSTLLALLKESASDQQEVTDQLGYQVREAVEVLVQSFDAIHQESQGAALKSTPPTAVYDAALTIMMRLVFLFSAEERGLLHLGKPLYDDNYAVSTLQEQLQEVADRYGEEVLERRYDAWARLLASFRAVHGGIQHQDLLMQAYGGSLFDPDRYPFLEGRTSGSTWRSQSADPLPVNNRVVLHLLNSLQRLRTKAGGAAETRRVSFRALGVEQIGHVYEGLLDHTAQRATEVVLGIRGTRNKEPEIPLSILEQLLAKGEDELLEHLKEETGRSVPALRKELNSTSVLDEHKLLVACRQDEVLLARLRPFAGLIREDSFERPWVVLPSSVFVTAGTTRRSTGTHYTPPSLTEPIVRHTLEPLVYAGPAEGFPKEEWKLKSPKEILALKVCDMAMGSGAFLVQACRYLAERLVEAWENEEKAHPGQVLITPEGNFSEGDPAERLVPAEAAERIAIARRVVADRCLYGVDINPMAVEMAKLSMWLITVDRNRPFTFLDHAFKCGDSLLGLASSGDLDRFFIDKNTGQHRLGANRELIQQLTEIRSQLESLPSETPVDISHKESLNEKSEALVWQLRVVSDIVIAGHLLHGENQELQSFLDALALSDPESFLDKSREFLGLRRPFHWFLEFPEVVGRGGFSCFIGNPPFLHGRRVSTTYGDDYLRYLKSFHEKINSSADFVAYFVIRMFRLAADKGVIGFISTQGISMGDTREASLDWILGNGGAISYADPGVTWPGTATVTISSLVIWKNLIPLRPTLSGKSVYRISGLLLADEGVEDANPMVLQANKSIVSTGTYVYGKGFVITDSQREMFIEKNVSSGQRIFPYLRGEDINKSPSHSHSDWVIDFGNMTMDEARRWPELFDWLEATVKKEREKQTKQVHEPCFWKHWDKRPDLYERLSLLRECLVHAFVGKHIGFAFVPANQIIATPTPVFISEKRALFAVLQSCVHGVWVIRRSSKMGSGIRYAPSDCFHTFPLPQGYEQSVDLEDAGLLYESVRKEAMSFHNEGLTKIYNRFHDPLDECQKIKNLRDASDSVNRAVVNSYGWDDINIDMEFRKSISGVRFEVSESSAAEMYRRLLVLNHQQHAVELESGVRPSVRPKKKKTLHIAGFSPSEKQVDLFDLEVVEGQSNQASHASSPIVDYLKNRTGWHSKDAILSGSGFPENRWNAAIRELLERGEIERQGERRGAKYRLAETQG